MGGLSGFNKTQSLEALPNYFNSSRSKGGGRDSQSWGTGFSKMSYGNVKIDPSIRAIQEQALAKNNNLYNALGDSAANLMGDQSEYIQARVDPLQQQIAKQQGDLQQSLGMRGLSGSSFADQSMTNFMTDSQRALGDARAQATNESLAQLAQIRAQQSNAIGMDFQTARDRLQQEMQALGLGSQQQQMMMQNFEQEQMRAEKDRTDIADISTRWMGGMGSNIGKGGSPSWGSTGGGSAGGGQGYGTGSGSFGAGGDWSGWRQYWGG